MRRDDFILTLTSGLLTANEKAFDTAVAHFSKLYELYQPAKPGLVSIAGMDANDQPTNYVEWLKAIRNAGVQSVYCYWYVQSSQHPIPAHIEAAFAGAQTLLMQVTTKKDTTTYRLRTILSPQYEITPQQFVELIDAQQHKDALWKRVEELINEFNAMNERSAIPTGPVLQYFQSQEGTEVYNFMVSRLVQEVQVECEVLGTPFHIPEHLQYLLYKSDLFFPDDNRMAVFLNPVGHVTPEAIQQLVQAQSFHDEVWGRLEASLQEFPIPGIPSTGWPAVLYTLDDASLQNVAHTICRAIVSLCEQHNIQPVIPEQLFEYFGPDELEGKRARARSGLSSKQWYLEGIQQPWELYVFTLVLVPAELPQPAGGIQQQFITRLQEIAELAKKIQSPFAEAFLSGAFLLNHPLPAGNFDDDHENEIAAILQQQGFSDQAVHAFRNTFYYSRDLHLLQWPAEKIYGLCAVGMADVFGGMGSWNDIDPGDEAVAYQRLSAELFETMKKYFAALLSS